MTMQEQEAIYKLVKNVKDDADELERYREIGTLGEFKALKEDWLNKFDSLIEYRIIGTVEEIRAQIEELKRWHTSETNPRIKNIFANTSTQICPNCDHKDEYIEELEAEIEKYKVIGTVEKCREAVEKQVPKIPNTYGDGYDDEGNLIYDMYECPNCGKSYEIDYDRYDYCPECGQKIDWSKEDE